MQHGQTTSQAHHAFDTFLRHAGFEGDVGRTQAERLIAATDNSVYQQMPALVVYPRHHDDLVKVVQAAQKTHLPIAPRGGGTGTNAQSLTSGVMVDLSRYMDRIIRFDAETETVRVQPGVILSRLNAFLKPYGVFFPPMVSTANRATIGGMIATDASGKGSRLYGKTSDYIERMDVVLSDGTSFEARHFSANDVPKTLEGEGLAARACREIYRVVSEQQAEIERVFPKMNRGLTGYNLKNILMPDGSFNPTRLLAGSEGTLALTSEIVLRVKKLPRYRRLLVIRYDDFDATLRHVQQLLPAHPLAIEVLDDRLLETARDDVSWAQFKDVLDEQTDRPVRGINFVEFVGDDDRLLAQHIEDAQSLSRNAHIIDCHPIEDASLIAQLWELRAKAVGLLGRPRENKQGVPFIEDTAVPPENLADYTAEFRHILDDYHLDYGMFGHADVGCLHVRPFLNMLDPNDQHRIRAISDKVAHLTHRYGGLLWGEHGRGVRGEFSPLFFGPTLFAELCHIKKAFDPKDLFNRGKLVPVEDHSVIKIDELPFRGSFDKQISAQNKEHYEKAILCNGNGACFNQEPTTTMCPSYKATKDRLQSPKGRAALLREWLRLSSLPDAQTSPEKKQLGKALKKTFDSCLACKACASQCPIRVDIPSLRSHFLHDYYHARLRPLRDYLVASLEPLLKIGRLTPGLTNFLMHNPLSRRVLTGVGLVDLPTLRPTHFPTSQHVTSSWLSQPSEKKIVLLQDSFTGSFDGGVLHDAYALFAKLGYDIRVTPILDNGKAQHVLGFRRLFASTARHILSALQPIASRGIPIITLDAATGLMFRHEYREIDPTLSWNVLAPEEFLHAEIQEEKVHFSPSSTQIASLDFLPHCTAKALTPETTTHWTHVMTHFGIALTSKATGCCGMAGLFGHERNNAPLSKKIFQDNWENFVTKTVTAGGFSCRCQTKRFTGQTLLHPIQALYQHIQKSPPT
ncbi:FAD-binding protein [Saccharibacter sp. 17.LH.SD]|uniref:FAD-binding and (Fe-S)-binding domain-containing protein n=1 Tax=Saccharibacter sp. 17.LH.SD TaxID=2689393 RepID=UPI00136DD941|nr:FAD-binding and (Fe-S)-binding domain-containing protein [Saccharibacter sp. 17.LH.SD]MXV44456.1 FAD-binding protein [Saccharibacter sp. 17.LH.SD]